MKNILLAILLLPLFSHAQSISWLKQGGYNRTDGYASSVTIDFHHNTIVGFQTDYYNPTFDVGFTTIAHKNAVIVKYDSSGNYVWGRTIMSPAAGCEVRAVKADNIGNVYVTGTFWTNPLRLSTSDSVLGSEGNLNGYLVKYDPDGTILWFKGFTASASTSVEPRALAIDNDNNVVLGGDFFYGADMGDTVLTGTQQNLMLLKYDQYGHFQWANVGKSIVYTWIGDMSCDSAGNIFFTGKVSSPVTFGTTVYSPIASYDQLYVAKANSSGHVLWFIRRKGNFNTGLIPHNNHNCGNGISTDTKGNVYVTGVITDSSLTVPGGPRSYNTYLAKFKTDGTPIWERKYAPGANLDFYDVWICGGSSVATDGCGSPYLTGSYTNGINLGTLTLPASDTNDHSYVAKIDTGTGDAIWAQYSTGRHTHSQGLAVDRLDGSIVGTGKFQTKVRFDDDSVSFVPYNPVNRNYYILKIANAADCPTPLIATITTTASSICYGGCLPFTGHVVGSIDSARWETIPATASIGAPTEDTTHICFPVSGTYTVVYTVYKDGTIEVATSIITADAMPTPSITGPGSVCVSATVSLSGGWPGGIWVSGSTGIAGISSGGILTGIATGTTDVTYSVTNSCGTGTTSATVTVNPLPVSGVVTGATAVCVGAAITLTSTVLGGVWSSSSTPVAVVGPLGDVTGISAGTANITYSFTNSCGTSNTIHTVTVNPLPSAGLLSGPPFVCAGATISLTSGVSGGLWSSGSPGIASVGGSGIVSGITSGTSIITYSVTNSCGVATATKVVTVMPLPVAGTITGTGAVCIDDVISLTSTVTGGSWSSSSTDIASVNSLGMTRGILAGTTTISYTVSNICGTATATFQVTVNSLPILTVQHSDTICLGACDTFIVHSSGNVLLWSPSSVSCVNCDSIIECPILSTSYSVKATDTNGCSSTLAFPVAVDSCIETLTKDVNRDNSVKIYPNPTKDELMVTSTIEIRDVVIVDVVGRIVLTQQVHSPGFNITTQTLPPGLYFLRLNNEFVRKFIKEE